MSKDSENAHSSKHIVFQAGLLIPIQRQTFNTVPSLAKIVKVVSKINIHYELFHTENKMQNWFSNDYLNESAFILIFSSRLIWHVVYHSLLVRFNWTGFLQALTNLCNMGKNSTVNKGKAGSTNYLQHRRTLCQKNPTLEIHFSVKAWFIIMLISHVNIPSMCHIMWHIWMCWCHVDEIYNPFLVCFFVFWWMGGFFVCFWFVWFFF